MATSQMAVVIQHLRRVLPDGAGLTDEQLLVNYISRRDEAAFAALVRRHGPMVWGVCSRVLRNHHDAEDAFQATFLVFVRRAASIASRGLLANWLYGVAHLTALKARATAAKRKGRERQVTEMPEPAVTQRDQLRDLQPVLDQELSRLPDHYRSVIVLCDLEGKTRKEIAVQLGCPEGTVASRLVRARTMLAKRLTNRGVPLLAGALAALLSQNVTSAGMPDSVVSSTITAGGFFATRQVAATGPVSVKVAALAEGVLKAMMISKLKAVVAVVLVLGFIVTGATVLACRTAATQGDKPTVAEEWVGSPQKQEKVSDKEGFTAWGKEVGGLQAGLGYLPGQKRAYSHGETAKVVLRVRNVGKEAVDFKYIWAFFVENPPKITDADGKLVQLPNYRTRDKELHMPRSTNVAPGKEVELYEWTFDLQPEGENSSRSFIHGTGKFSLQCERIVGPTWLNPDHPNPILSKLATGELELDVKDAEKLPEKLDTEKIDQLIRQLGSSKFTDRAAASKALAEIGEPALPALRRAAAADVDLETRRRVELLVRNIERRWEVLCFKGHTDAVAAAVLSPDGRLVLSAGRSESNPRLWDVKTGKELRQFHGHTSWVWSVAFTPDGKRAISAGVDGMRLWEVETGKELRRFGFPLVDLKPGLEQGRFGFPLVDLKPGQEQQFGGHTRQVYRVVISADGHRALSGSQDRTVRLWDVDTGKELGCFSQHGDEILSVALSPDGQRAVSTSADNTMRLWEVDKGKVLHQLPGARCAVFSPDGRHVLSGGPDKFLRLWDLTTGKELRSFRGHEAEVGCVAFSANGEQALSGSADNTVRLWDVRTAKELRCFHGHESSSGISSVAFCPDGKRALSASYDMTMRLWQLLK
jgi:RNA polymerase sigma factor (sigma-70 family)